MLLTVNKTLLINNDRLFIPSVHAMLTQEWKTRRCVSLSHWLETVAQVVFLLRIYEGPNKMCRVQITRTKWTRRTQGLLWRYYYHLHVLLFFLIVLYSFNGHRNGKQNPSTLNFSTISLGFDINVILALYLSSCIMTLYLELPSGFRLCGVCTPCYLDCRYWYTGRNGAHS